MERLRHRAGRDDEEIVARSVRVPAAPPAAQLLLQLQRSAGNAAVARAIARAPAAGGGLLSGATDLLGEMVAAALTIRLSGSVGRGGKNAAADVDAIRGRLQALGFPAAAGPEPEGGGDLLGEAIARYQGEVVGSKHPDGRVDPGGRTLRAINAGQRAPEPEAPAAGDAAAPTPAGPVPIPYPNTGGAEPAGPAPRAGSSGAGALASAGPAVAAVSAELGRLTGDLETLLAESRAADKETAKANKALPKGAQKQPLNLGQETGPKRDRLVDGIEKVRAQIGALSPASTGLDAKELHSVKAELYRRADHLSPYYFQMANANVLYDSDTKAGGRTCNVTSISMCLEAMGKSIDDFTGNTALLSVLADHFASALTDASDKGAGLGGLRLPDFLQLLAVAECMDGGAVALSPQDPAFAKAVEAGRTRAVNAVLKSGEFFIKLTTHFGVTVKSQSLFDGRMRELIDMVGEVNRKAIPAALKASKKKADGKSEGEVKESVVGYYDQKLAKDIETADATLKELEAKLPGSPKKLAGKVTAPKGALAHLKDIQASGIYDRAIDPKALDELQPLDVYAATVQEGLSKHLDAGHQIVGHVYNHFIRVEGVEDEGVRIDDPGSYARHDYLLKWREAREIGGFTRFNTLE